MRRARALAVLLLSVPAAAQVRLAPVEAPLAAPAVSVTALPPAAIAVPAPALSLSAPLAAPSAVPAPAPSAPALAALPAVAAAAAPSEPDVPGAGVESRTRSLDAFWDGFAPAAAPEDETPVFVPDAAGFESFSPESAAEPRAAPAVPWLTHRDRALSAALDRAATLALSTRVGRRAFAAAGKALKERALPVRVLDLKGNYGEYDYVAGTLRLHKALFAPGRETDLAGTLIHELTHVAQHAQGLPSNALELEIEAHLADLAFMEELGLQPPPNTFARQAQKALAKSPEDFARLLEAAVPGSPFLGGGTAIEELVERLEEDLDELSERSGPRAEALARVVARDLELLRSASGRKAYADFSRRVMDLLRRRSAAAKRA
ncbi:MAG: hypothetical protein KGM24_07380 [Elusimicrobia bacterium]|nr:hypothetical protein [Elusimicrobiota bacterium]